MRAARAALRDNDNAKLVSSHGKVKPGGGKSVEEAPVTRGSAELSSAGRARRTRRPSKNKDGMAKGTRGIAEKDHVSNPSDGNLRGCFPMPYPGFGGTGPTRVISMTPQQTVSATENKPLPRRGDCQEESIHIPSSGRHSRKRPRSAGMQKSAAPSPAAPKPTAPKPRAPKPTAISGQDVPSDNASVPHDQPPSPDHIGAHMKASYTLRANSNEHSHKQSASRCIFVDSSAHHGGKCVQKASSVTSPPVSRRVDAWKARTNMKSRILPFS